MKGFTDISQMPIKRQKNPAKLTQIKRCYCHTCHRPFHYLGITRHRAMHRDKREDCTIEYTHGDTWTHKFSKWK